MKMSYLLSVLLFFSFTVCAQSNNTIKALDSVLAVLYNLHEFNGSVLYAEKGKVLYKNAFGVADIRTGEPLKTNASFNLASVTKQFICMGIMILSENGLLTVDDDVKKYIPELPYKGVTVRNLMTHTSGIPEYFDYFVKSRGPLDTLTNDMMIKLFADLKPPLDFETGSQWQYSNTNYVLLSSIIQRLSAMPVEKFIDEKIVKPLGLKETYMYHVYLPSQQNRN